MEGPRIHSIKDLGIGQDGGISKLVNSFFSDFYQNPLDNLFTQKFFLTWFLFFFLRK